MVAVQCFIWWFWGFGLGNLYWGSLWWSIGRSLRSSGQGWLHLRLLRVGGLGAALVWLIGPAPLGLGIALGGIGIARWFWQGLLVPYLLARPGDGDRF